MAVSMAVSTARSALRPIHLVNAKQPSFSFSRIASIHLRAGLSCFNAVESSSSASLIKMTASNKLSSWMLSGGLFPPIPWRLVVGAVSLLLKSAKAFSTSNRARMRSIASATALGPMFQTASSICATRSCCSQSRGRPTRNPEYHSRNQSVPNSWAMIAIKRLVRHDANGFCSDHNFRAKGSLAEKSSLIVLCSRWVASPRSSPSAPAAPRK